MIGWDWPFSFFWFFVLAVFLLAILFFHGRLLIKATMPKLAWKLITLRIMVVLLFLLLIARPFITTNEPNPKDFHLVTLTDLSGSMNAKDGANEPKRIDKVKPFIDRSNNLSWLTRIRNDYGKVESLGFSDDLQRMNQNSTDLTELGKNTALGDALSSTLRNSSDKQSLGSVVFFRMVEIIRVYPFWKLPSNIEPKGFL